MEETKEPVAVCPFCGSDKVTFGVFDRIELIKDKEKSKSPANRPPYVYQVPLTFIPGVGNKTIDRLLDSFGTEMTILHKLSKDDIEAVVGEKVANEIIASENTCRWWRSLRKSNGWIKNSSNSKIIE